MTAAQDQASRLRQLVENLHDTPKPCRVIAVTSGKGGTGKSVFCVNLAVALAQMEKRVLIIDADFGLANVDLMLGVSSGMGLAHVLSGEIAPQQALQIGVCGVRILSGGSGVEALMDIEETQAASMMAGLLQLQSDADIILVDTGAGASPVVMRLVMAADEAVIVTTPEPTAAMDAYALIKSLSRRKGRLPSLHLVVNRVSGEREARETTDAIATLALRNMSVAVNPLGAIVSDEGMTAAVKRQTPLLMSHPQSPAARNIAQIARRLTGTAAQAHKHGFAGFLSRLIRTV